MTCLNRANGEKQFQCSKFFFDQLLTGMPTPVSCAGCVYCVRRFEANPFDVPISSTSPSLSNLLKSYRVRVVW